MDSFRTELILSAQPLPFGLKDRFFTTGSCFANAIGSRLEQFKFSAMTNPFGTTYNPISIHRQLSWAVSHQPPQQDFINNGEVFVNYHFHSQFSSPVKSDLETSIGNLIQESGNYLKSATCLLITYGTSWVYQLKAEKEIVANCHKQPSTLFEKRLLSQTEIEESFAAFYDLIIKANPSIRIILTVSPVRHIKDTLPLNSVSKSLLRLACYSISQKFENVTYFPAYEIMMDDLRDYRFYQRDRIHPTEEAEDYIWQKFLNAHFDSTSVQFIETWKEIRSALAHKPFHPESPRHQQFLKDLLLRLEKLQSVVDTNLEIEIVKEKIHRT